MTLIPAQVGFDRLLALGKLGTTRFHELGWKMGRDVREVAVDPPTVTQNPAAVLQRSTRRVLLIDDH